MALAVDTKLSLRAHPYNTAQTTIIAQVADAPMFCPSFETKCGNAPLPVGRARPRNGGVEAERMA